MDENRRPTRHELFAELDDGWTMSAEFVSAVLVWTGIGWLVDNWLGTTPWLLAIGTLLGFVLGIYLAWLRIRPVAPDEDQTPQRT
jgi:ATP synthase protein I